jgi:hypothetical protein
MHKDNLVYPQNPDHIGYGFHGLTVRDYIAIQAMNGLLSDQREGSAWSCWDDHEIARYSYRLADAMIAKSEER